MSEGPIKTGGPTWKRRPAFKGIIQQDVSHGKERVRAWPRSRGKPKTAEAKELQDAFREAQESAKYWDPRNIIDIDQWRRGTPILIRDVQTAMMYNRMFELRLKDGRRLVSMPAQQNVSDALDAICPLPGALLVRDADRWRYITPPSAADQVLTVGDDLEPLWASPASGGNANWWFQYRPLSSEFPVEFKNTKSATKTDSANTGLYVQNAPLPADGGPHIWAKVNGAAGGLFKVTARITPNISLEANNYAGMWLVDNTAHRAFCFGQVNNFTTVGSRWGLPATLNSNPWTGNDLAVKNKPMWLQAERIGTNIELRISGDGEHWAAWFTEPLASWLTNGVSHIGLGVSFAGANTRLGGLSCDCWQQNW